MWLSLAALCWSANSGWRREQITDEEGDDKQTLVSVPLLLPLLRGTAMCSQCSLKHGRASQARQTTPAITRLRRLAELGWAAAFVLSYFTDDYTAVCIYAHCPTIIFLLVSRITSSRLFGLNLFISISKQNINSSTTMTDSYRILLSVQK